MGFFFWPRVSGRTGGRLDVNVGVFGATGYAGRELVRILSGHPRARTAFTTGTGEGHLAHEAGLAQNLVLC